MSRGLGALQREIKETLDRAFDLRMPWPRYTDLRSAFAIKNGDTLTPAQERSLKRALKGLVDCGDVIPGAGGSGGRCYATVETMASFFCDEVRNTAHAKQVFAKANAEARVALPRLRWWA